MKRLIKFAALNLVVALALSTVVAVPSNAATSLLFGQKHAYSAVVRTDKRVVVYGKIFLSNPKDQAVTNASFTLPSGVEASNISIFQVTLSDSCKNSLKTAAPSSEDLIARPYYDSCEQLERNAFGFDDYYGYYYDSSDANAKLVYKEIQSAVSGATYSFDLPEAIESNSRGAYLVSYMAEKGFVSGNLGVYDLKFKTLEVADSIEEVRVSVDVSSDLYTRAKRSAITRTSSELSIADAAKSSSGNGITSDSLDSLQSTIGRGGAFEKTGKALAPNETFVVNGTFADSAWKLYIWQILGLLLAAAVAVAAIVFLLKMANNQNRLSSKKGVYRGKNRTK